MTEQTTTEVALPSDNRPPTLAQRITGLEHQFALAAPRGFEAQQLVRDALTALAKEPKLAQCEPTSVLGGLMTLAQLGLRPGVLGHGWILPFWNGRARQFEAQLVIGYQGLIALAYRSQMIDRITARKVHENDHFRVEYGLNETLEHVPAKLDRGEVVGYYATVKIKGAGEAMFYHLTKPEAELYRDRYAMAKKKDGTIVGPWVSNFDDMAMKTCIRQLSKFMPKGTDLATALAVDDTVRVDITPSADPVHVSEHPEPAEVAATAHADTPADDLWESEVQE